MLIKEGENHFLTFELQQFTYFYVFIFNFRLKPQNILQIKCNMSTVLNHNAAFQILILNF